MSGDDLPELSSLASALDEMIERVDAIANRRVRADPDDALASDLFEVDRLLHSARRRLSRSLRQR